MAAIHVCSLSRLESVVRETGTKSMVTLLSPGTDFVRPAPIAPERHLHLMLSDIVDPMDGAVLAGVDHVAALLAFMRAWDQRDPLLIHCYAGVSRSTAAAFIAACALRPDQAEADIALRLRQASKTATPNRRLAALGDDMLARQGRMVRAIAAIGQGAACFEGAAFRLSLD